MIGLLFFVMVSTRTPAQDADADVSSSTSSGGSVSIRFATFNVALHRRSAGRLVDELKPGDSRPAKRLAEIIQRVQPDILLLNEIDYDDKNLSVQYFCDHYLANAQNGQQALNYPHRFVAAVNTGMPSGLDLDGDGRSDGRTDAYGYGAYPGQFGMAVLSRFPIDAKQVRTFQKFLWRDMPDASVPQTQNGKDFYSEEIMQVFRLSSKSHWDVPIRLRGQLVHFLVSHPTPPVFDGPEDRNGRRNHDEIRFWSDYVSGDRGSYIYDDKGGKGGLPAKSHFVIAGDLNADPVDGDSTDSPMDQLLQHPRIQGDVTPSSRGAIKKGAVDGLANLRHRGDAAHDTGDFADNRAGNLRIDYVLPSAGLPVVDRGVFWPEPKAEGSELVDASDHRLVWIDVQIP